MTVVYSVVALLPFLKLRFYLSYIGRNTLPILFLHFLSFKLITFFAVVINGEPDYMIAAHPILAINDKIWIAYTIMGLVGPLMINVIYISIKGFIKKWCPHGLRIFLN